jgi:hypothetical protein
MLGFNLPSAYLHVRGGPFQLNETQQDEKHVHRGTQLRHAFRNVLLFYQRRIES